MARKWWTLLLVCVGAFMLLLDITVVTVALPDIERDLDASLTDLQWVLDAYALALGALTLIAGSLADRFGRRLVFTLGMGIFTAASLACGLAGDPLVLDVARGVQGIGGAAMFGTTIALIAQEFSGRERTTALGIWGAVVGIAVAIGPLVGGGLVDTLGWPWIFYINIPIGVAAIVLSIVKVRESREPQTGGIDWPGLVTLGPGLFLVIYAVLSGNPSGWTSVEVIGSFTVGVLLLVAFVIAELRSPNPMFDIRLFRVPTFVGAQITAFTLAFSLFAMLAYFVLYLQNVLGHSAIAAGAALLPITVLAFIFSPIAAELAKRVPMGAILGVGMAAIGFGFIALYGLDGSSDWQQLMLGFGLAGVGVGLVNPPLAEVAVAIRPTSQAGMLTGINNTFRQVGVAAGIAVLGALLEHRIFEKMQDLFAQGPSELQAQSSELGRAAASGRVEAALASVPEADVGFVQTAARDAFVSGLNELNLIGAAIAFIGAVAAFALIRAKDFDPEAMVEAAAPEAEQPLSA